MHDLCQAGNLIGGRSISAASWHHILDGCHTVSSAANEDGQDDHLKGTSEGAAGTHTSTHLKLIDAELFHQDSVGLLHVYRYSATIVSLNLDRDPGLVGSVSPHAHRSSGNHPWATQSNKVSIGVGPNSLSTLEGMQQQSASGL